MSLGSPAADRGWAVGLRTLAVVGFLLAVAFGCSFEGGPGLPPEPVPPSARFAGCFKGEAVLPDTGGSVTVALEVDEGPDPDAPLQLSLLGCLDVEVGARDEVITVTGQVDESALEEARLDGMFNDGTPITVDIVRSPAGDVPAESLSLRGTGDEFQVDETEICESTFEELGCTRTLTPGGGGGA